MVSDQPLPAEDSIRVPTNVETTAALDRAHRAIAEIDARDAYDHDQEVAERVAQLSAWDVEDRTEERDEYAELGYS